MDFQFAFQKESESLWEIGSSLSVNCGRANVSFENRILEFQNSKILNNANSQYFEHS